MKKLLIAFIFLFLFTALSPRLAEARWVYDWWGFPYWVCDQAPYTTGGPTFYANNDGSYDVLFKWKETPSTTGYSLNISKVQFQDPGAYTDTTANVWTFHNIYPGTWYVNMKIAVNGTWSCVTSWTITVPAWVAPSPTPEPSSTPSPAESSTFQFKPFIALGLIGTIVYFVYKLFFGYIERRVKDKKEKNVLKIFFLSKGQRGRFFYIGLCIAGLIFISNIGLADKFCPRTTPYPMAPEFQRALSLIGQRVSQVYGSGDPNKSVYNCLDIQYGDAGPNAEGFFLFDTRFSKIDDLKIIVDSSYRRNDDLLTAILLSHEVTHAWQFADELKNGNVLSCVDKEVGAFQNEYSFVTVLNPEEKSSLISRLSNNDPNTALWGVYNLFSFTSGAQTYRDTQNQIESMVKDSPYYQRQCSLTQAQ